VEQPNDFSPVRTKPPRAGVASVLMVTAAPSVFTVSLAKLASQRPSLPILESRRSANGFTSSISPAEKRPASMASRARRPREAELQWKNHASAVEGHALPMAKVAAARSRKVPPSPPYASGR
jgi:hypothetical protein